MAIWPFQILVLTAQILDQAEKDVEIKVEKQEHFHLPMIKNWGDYSFNWKLSVFVEYCKPCHSYFDSWQAEPMYQMFLFWIIKQILFHLAGFFSNNQAWMTSSDGFLQAHFLIWTFLPVSTKSGWLSKKLLQASNGKNM